MSGGSGARPQWPAHPQHVDERHGGRSGELTNRFNPLYVQFYKNADIVSPSGTFVFLDEHADTINDGFFVNRLDDYAWGNPPGSYHNRGVNLSYADGHLESHRWLVPETVRPVLRTRVDKYRRPDQRLRMAQGQDEHPETLERDNRPAIR